MKLGHELKRLGRHSAIYGLGGLVSRILATLLLPLYTHYLPPGSYGRVEIVTAATAVLAIVLQMGISSGFFRFYFDAENRREQLTVLFRVEERSTQYAVASIANVLITVAAMVLFVAVFQWGAVGLVVGNFTGTLLVYSAL